MRDIDKRAVTMSLGIVLGAFNSGRTGEILERFEAAAAQDPILVVPTADDIHRFQSELASRPGTALGGTVTAFPGLFDEIAATYDVARPSAATETQRAWIAQRAASADRRLRVLRQSAEQPGFGSALAALIDDLYGTGLDGVALAALVADGPSGDYERELSRLVLGYEAIRDDADLVDTASISAATTAALRADPASWTRPVFIYGFDDLTRPQVELLDALARATEVTVAIAFEDRTAFAARAELPGLLREELGAELLTTLTASAQNTPSQMLHGIERGLFETHGRAVGSDGSVRLLEAAGERDEAELIGSRVAELIAGGCEPGEIAIAVRSPDRHAPLLGRVLAGMGIPVATEASVPLGATGVGTGLERLLALVTGEGEAADLLAVLRTQGRISGETIDWLERRIRRGRISSGQDAIELMEQRSGPLLILDRLRETLADPTRFARTIAWVAADIAEAPHRRSGTVPSAGEAVEIRAGAVVGQAVDELCDLGAIAPGPGDWASILGELEVPLWRGSTEGRVRIASPYRLRASRVDHLVIAGLTDGNFPGSGGSDPLLGDERRAKLGLRERRDPAAEERYLFYAALTRPRLGLTLSYSRTDDRGIEIERSPFVDDVRRMIEPAPPADGEDELERALTTRGSLAEVAPAPGRATTPRELARALAAVGSDRGEQVERLEAPEVVVSRALAAVERADAAVSRAAEPTDIRDPHLLAELSGRRDFSASALEAYGSCPYIWFVGRQLSPETIDPDPDPLDTGGLIHEALEALYRSRPASEARPTPGSLGAWRDRGRETLEGLAAERGWPPEAARTRINLERLGALIDRFLERDAAEVSPLEPAPELLELSFGMGEGSPDPVEIGDFRIRGKIDRVDRSSTGRGLIRDYKIGTKVVTGKKLLDEGKLQLQLYMVALRALGIDPVGAVYHPLGASPKSDNRGDRPRGLLTKSERGGLISAETDDFFSSDFFEDEQLDEMLGAAVEKAQAIVDSIRAGSVTREPLGGDCPSYCGLAPICRMERSTPEPDDELAEDAL